MIVLLMCATLLPAQKNDAFQTAMYMEKWQKAVTFQEERCKTAPTDWLDWLQMADAYNAASRPIDAKTALQNAAKYASQSAHTHIIAGRIALLDARQDEAILQFKKAVKAGKKDVATLRLIGESWLYGPRRDLRRAETLLLDAQRGDNHDFLTHMNLGYCYKAQLDGGKALVYFDLAQAIRPDDPLPALMSALAYKSAKVEARQLEYLDKALAIDPQCREALRQKAELFYYKRRNYEAAAESYASLFKINPKAPITDKMAYVNCLFLTKQYEPTIAWVEKIIGEDGSRNYLRRLAAYSHYEMGNFEKGKSIMDEYFQHVATEKIISQDYEYYAKFLQKENQDSLAAVYYEKAIELDPTRWDLYAEIGSIRYKAKDYLGAAEAYERRLDSMTTRTALDYYQVGIARYMLRDSVNYERAAGYFAKVCDIVPYKTIGWLMQAKALSKLEPDVETYPERVGEFGKAKEAFVQFVEIAERQPDKHKKDLVSAYEYLAYYYILQKDAEPVQAYHQKILALEPANETALGIAGWLQRVEAED